MCDGTGGEHRLKNNGVELQGRHCQDLWEASGVGQHTLSFRGDPCHHGEVAC